MFGVVPKALWSRLVDVADDNTVALQTNCLLLRDGERTVLVETGNGGKWSAKERGIYHMEDRTVLDALADAGVDRGDVTDVIVTHLHFDHAGGLTHWDGPATEGATPPASVSSFPNAKIHIQQREWDDARANRAVMTRTYLASHLEPIADQVVAANGDTEIAAGLRLMPTPGHTWGQQAIVAETDRGTVCFPADVMPTRAHIGPAFNTAYDIEPYTNMLTKQAMLERAAAEGWIIALGHDAGDPLVQVRTASDRPGTFELVDAAAAAPA